MDEDILEQTDVPLLLDKKFKYGFSGTTLWKPDTKGQMWCVRLDAPGEVLIWYPVRDNGGLNPSVTVSRQMFGEMFP